jgi:coronin-1B/1C/6
MKHIFARDIKREEDTWYGLKPTTQTGDHSMITASSKFFATPVFGGGGPLFVGKMGEPKRLDARSPVIYGHAGAVTDTAWHPFNPHLLCTGGADAVIKVWQIPEEGVTKKMTQNDALNSLEGHSKRVLLLEFHPSANNVLGSVDFNKEVMLWDITRGEPVKTIEVHDSPITDFKWNRNGSLCGTGCKDKKVRIFDPRLEGESVVEIDAHPGSKPIKLTFDKLGRVLTFGMGKTDREMKVWDPRNPAKPLFKLRLGKGSGTMLPWYDEALDLVYLGEKGSPTVQVLEMIEDNSYYKCATVRAEVHGGSPKGMCLCPKLACDVMQSEVARMMFVGRDCVCPAFCVVPRRSKQFQEDLFPEDRIEAAGQSAETYFAGGDADPVLGSMDPKQRQNSGGGSTFKKAKSRAEVEAELAQAQARIRLLEAEIASMRGQLA